MTEVTIYTDGACSGNPGPGGWAAVLIYGEYVKEIAGFDADTTNNRMEMTAAINALKMLKFACKVNLHTDSSYLCNAFNLKWIAGWQRNGFMTSKKEPVENQDLWNELITLNQTHDIHWRKVAGHADDYYNNRCDELARGAIKSALKKSTASARHVNACSAH